MQCCFLILPDSVTKQRNNSNPCCFKVVENSEKYKKKCHIFGLCSHNYLLITN